jgi:hypothetical protein
MNFCFLFRSVLGTDRGIGFGTVTGGVAGFMVGFAGGFAGESAKTIIASLLSTCGQPKKIVVKKYEGCYQVTYSWGYFSYALFVTNGNSSCRPIIDISNLY